MIIPAQGGGESWNSETEKAWGKEDSAEEMGRLPVLPADMHSGAGRQRGVNAAGRGARLVRAVTFALKGVACGYL